MVLIIDVNKVKRFDGFRKSMKNNAAKNKVKGNFIMFCKLHTKVKINLSIALNLMLTDLP